MKTCRQGGRRPQRGLYKLRNPNDMITRTPDVDDNPSQEKVEIAVSGADCFYYDADYTLLSYLWGVQQFCLWTSRSSPEVGVLNGLATRLRLLSLTITAMALRSGDVTHEFDE